MYLNVLMDGQAHRVHIEHLGGAHYRVRVDDREASSVRIVSHRGAECVLQIDSEIEHLVVSETDPARVLWKGASFECSIDDPRKRSRAQEQGQAAGGGAQVKAAMPGTIVTLLKQEGDSVRAGQGLVVIESMKMQNEIRSPRDGLIVGCHVEQGQSVEAGQMLFALE